MFNQWMVAPTSAKSKLKYCPITMTDRYKDWAPSWFTPWKLLGPPAGNQCCAVFMSECCGFTAVPEAETIIPCNALDRHFDQIQASNAMGVSRAKAALQRREELKKERDSELSSSSATIRSSSSSQLTSQILVHLELRKERRLLRDQEIDRLSWLIKRAGLKNDFAKEYEWQLQLDSLYESPLVEIDSDVITSLLSSPDTPPPRSTPTPVKPALACSISVCAQPFSPISKLVTTQSTNDEQLMFIASRSTKDMIEKISEGRSEEEEGASERAKVELESETPPENAGNDVEADSVNEDLAAELEAGTPPKKVGNNVEAFDGEEAAIATSQLALNDAKQAKLKQLFIETQQRKHQTLFVQLLFSRFKRVDIPKDGHCLFHCFAYFFNRHGMMMVDSSDPSYDPMNTKAGDQFSAKIIRNLCADELIRWKGQIPGLTFVVFFFVYGCSHVRLTFRLFS